MDHNDSADDPAQEPWTRDAHYAALVDSALVAIVSTSLDGTILIWNAGAERLLGYGADEVMGQSVDITIPPEYRSEIASMRARVQAGANVPIINTIRLHKDGRRISVTINLSPVLDQRGAIVGYSGILQDNSERKKAEEARALLASVVEYSDDAIITKTLDGTITSWNRGATNLFAYQP